MDISLWIEYENQKHFIDSIPHRLYRQWNRLSVRIIELCAWEPRNHVIAEQTRTLPLTARRLSLMDSKSGHVGKLPVAWHYAVGVARYSGFPHYLQMASRDLA